MRRGRGKDASRETTSAVVHVALGTHDGLRFTRSTLPPLAERRAGFEDDRAACDTLIDEAHVGTVPGNSFFADPEDGRTFLRFCFAKEMPVLEEACRNLRAAFAPVAA